MLLRPTEVNYALLNIAVKYEVAGRTFKGMVMSLPDDGAAAVVASHRTTRTQKKTTRKKKRARRARRCSGHSDRSKKRSNPSFGEPGDHGSDIQVGRGGQM